MLLGKLVDLPQLTGYWIDRFLANASFIYPEETAMFLLRRLDVAVAKKDYQFRPVNVATYAQVALRFRETQQVRTLMEQVCDWVRDKTPDHWLHTLSADLFGAMFGPYDHTAVAFLDAWLDECNVDDITLIAHLLGEAQWSFALDYRTFVARSLSEAKRFGEEPYNRMLSTLIRSTAHGPRQGIGGKAHPLDVEIKRRAQEILNELPRWSTDNRQ